MQDTVPAPVLVDAEYCPHIPDASGLSGPVKRPVSPHCQAGARIHSHKVRETKRLQSLVLHGGAPFRAKQADGPYDGRKWRHYGGGQLEA